MCSSTNRHAREALGLVGLVVEGAGRAGVAEEGGGVEDVAVLADAGGDGGLVGEERERVRRARRAGVVAFEGLVGAGAAADAVCQVCAARLEAGGAHARAGAVAGALVEVLDARAGVGARGGRGARRVRGAGRAAVAAERCLVRVVGTRDTHLRREEIVPRHAEAGREAAGAGRRGVEVRPARGALELIGFAVAAVRAQPAGAAGRAVGAGATAAGGEASGRRRRLGVGGARETRAVGKREQGVFARRAQRARAAGGAAKAGVAHAGSHVRRRWWRSRVPSAGGARGAAGGGLVGARGAGRAVQRGVPVPCRCKLTC